MFDCGLSGVMTDTNIVGFFMPWLECLVSDTLYNVDISHFFCTSFQWYMKLYELFCQFLSFKSLLWSSLIH